MTKSMLAVAVVAAAIGTGLYAGLTSQAARHVISVTQTQTIDADEAEARQVLGRPVPFPQFLPLGAARSAMTMDPAGKPAGARFVHQSFAVNGRDIARLDAVRSASPITTEESRVAIGANTYSVGSFTLDDGTAVVTYLWQADGLLMRFKINLVSGIDRQIADRVVASIR